MIFLLSGLIALIVSFIATPLVISLAKRFNFMDDPKRSHPAILHKKPLPRAGGLPLLVGFLIALIIIAVINPNFAFTKALWGIAVASTFLVVVGLLDDKYDLNPYLRLGTNIIAVVIVVASGIGISSFTNPLGGQVLLNSSVVTLNFPAWLGILAGSHHLIIFADLIAFFWIIWIMNALNWSSGVDGQLSGIAAISLLILGIAALQLTKTDPAQNSSAIIAFAATGAFLGFLPWSFYPQKIMPGYGGSTLAGFLIAVLAILSGAKLATALLVLLIPLVDSVWAVTRRILQGHSPVWGDKLHLHHQLLKKGWDPRQICFFYYSICLCLGILALNFDSQEKFFALSILGVLVFALLFTTFSLLKGFNIGGDAKSQ